MKPSITPAELKILLKKNKEVLIIDLRSKEEYLITHIPLALNITLESIESGHFVPENEKILITVCGKGGGRSERAANFLKVHFSNKVYYLEGGTNAWLS